MSSATNKAAVLCWNTPTKIDECAQEIATFQGAEPISIHVNAQVLTGDAPVRKLMPDSTCLIASAETLAKLGDALGSDAALLSNLADRAKHLFVYGFLPNDRHRDLLRILSCGRLVDVQPAVRSGAPFQFADGHRVWCGPFSGLSVGAADSAIDGCFVESNDSANRTVLIRIEDRPFLVQTEYLGMRVFFVACRQLADLQEEVQRGRSLLQWSSRLLPLMMFLRGALGEQVWHNHVPRACFVIDDPLLTTHYGFLDYGQLVESMKKRRFTACIAFIPWNYRRSDNQTARLFHSNGRPGLHLCVHGCDHTRREFASSEYHQLCSKAELALQRMREHTRRMDVPFEDVMVFPQGLFSMEALSALKASGYLAAVNTDPIPVESPVPLKLSNFLDVAVTQVAGFPLFGRHYPRDIAEFALDIFLGKPVLAVEHHGFFRKGCESLEAFVEQLNNIDGRLEWNTLGEVCSRASLTRKTAQGDVQVRFYTNRFSLMNTEDRPREYCLYPQLNVEQEPSNISCDVPDFHCDKSGGQIRIRLALRSRQRANITIRPADTGYAARPWQGSALYNSGVLVRRMLCEFRDNCVDTSQTLTAIVSGVRAIRSRASVQGTRSHKDGKATPALSHSR